MTVVLAAAVVAVAKKSLHLPRPVACMAAMPMVGRMAAAEPAARHMPAMLTRRRGWKRVAVSWQPAP